MQDTQTWNREEILTYLRGLGNEVAITTSFPSLLVFGKLCTFPMKDAELFVERKLVETLKSVRDEIAKLADEQRIMVAILKTVYHLSDRS